MARKGDASIRAYVGGSGFGKSLSVAGYLRETRPARLIVWDPQDENGAIASAVASLPDLIAATAGARFAVRYVPPGHASGKEMERRFATFCAVAYARAGSTVYVEELSGVTTPSRAPAAWKKLCVRGRHQGLTVIGCAQRPAQVDKDFFSNCTFVRVFGGLREPAGAVKMASILRVSPDLIDGLQPREFIERDFLAGEVRRGIEPVPGQKKRPPALLRGDELRGR
jgi:hypothetical protein